MARARSPTKQVEESAQVAPTEEIVRAPAQAIRIARMAMELLAEVQAAPLDEAARSRFHKIHDASIGLLEASLSPELVAELDRVTTGGDDHASSSDAELRVAQAQLVGWLKGLLREMEAAVIVKQIQTQLSTRQANQQLVEHGASDPHPGDGVRSGSYL